MVPFDQVKDEGVRHSSEFGLVIQLTTVLVVEGNLDGVDDRAGAWVELTIQLDILVVVRADHSGLTSRDVKGGEAKLSVGEALVQSHQDCLDFLVKWKVVESINRNRKTSETFQIFTARNFEAQVDLEILSDLLVSNKSDLADLWVVSLDVSSGHIG